MVNGGSNICLKELFGDYVTFDDNLDTLYDRIVDDYKFVLKVRCEK